MALDFPSSPVDGQVYDNFIYNSSKGTWKSISAGASPTILVNPTITSPIINNAVITATATTPSTIPLTVNGIASQTANLQSWQNSSGTALSVVNNIGTFATSGKVIGTTQPNAGSDGGIAVKAPASGTQTSGFLQFVNNAYSAQWASIEATPSSELKLNATYVKMPSQPTFFAWQQEGVGTYFTSAVTNPIFTSTLINAGNNYSTSTGRFTAPISGTYEFNCMLCVRSSSAAAELTFRKNGSNVVGRNLAYSNPSGAGGHDPAHYSIYIDLAANDYITPWISVNGSSGTDVYYGGGLGWFSGRLVG